MTVQSTSTTVGDWVAQYPHTSRVFESLQIDYCCGGGKSLEAACRERQLDPQQVVEQLEQAIQTSGPASDDWLTASLSELCDHIEQTHHAYLKTELPRLDGIIAKVVNAHGPLHPELSEVQETFAALRGELEPHMFKEEMVLFPAIRAVEQAESLPSFPFGTVANPIRMMEHEHDIAGDALAAIRRLTVDYQVPGGACNTYRAMLSGLAELEADLHQHIHKENNILFPRAKELESARA